MHIDIIPTEAWESLGDELKKSFSGALFPDGAAVQLRSYRGVGHAAFEVAHPLTQLYAHKRNIAAIKGLSPAFDFLIAQYLKEAYTVQITEHLQVGSKAAWVDQLKKETNFVLLAEDHPITGEIFETEELDQILNDKKIYSIRVSHARHIQATDEIRPYSARILSFGPDLAVVVYGSKFKPAGLTAPQMGWDKVSVVQKIQRKRKRMFDQNLVQSFENSLSQWKFFTENTLRLFDRSLLTFPDISGEALIQEIADGLSLNKNSINDLISTTNQCAWDEPYTFGKWWIPTPVAEVLRGTVVFSAEILARKEFANLVKASYDKVKGLQESLK